jgi:predicted enzyme related to lactoylglutathione lyase
MLPISLLRGRVLTRGEWAVNELPNPVYARPVGSTPAEGDAVTVKRVVPNIGSDQLDASREFYIQVFGLEMVMDMGWIVTLASPSEPTAQITLFGPVESSDPAPSITIEVDDVDAVHDDVSQRGLEILYPLTSEEWGVRRFFLADPNGVVINVMSHNEGPDDS